MSKELPPELRPERIANTAHEAGAEAIACITASVGARRAWLLIALDGADGVQMHGTVGRTLHAKAILVAAVESLGMVAEALHDEPSQALAGAIMELLGARTEYVSGGVVPARK